MDFLCGVLMIFSGFTEITFSADDVKVIGPAAPVVGEAGKDLVLPCSLQPNISAEGMMVEWIRTDLNEADTIVHLYEDRKDRNYDQMESYRGRTALFYEELKRGNASLKLSAVQLSDDGAYKCRIESSSWGDEITLYVKVKAGHVQVVSPAAPLVAEVAHEEIILPCSLQPNISAEGLVVEWIRTDLNEADTIVHHYRDRKDINDKQMESYRGRTALFYEELKKGNASLKLSAVQLSDEGAYQCHVAFRSWHDETKLYVEVKENVFHAWKIAVICISVFSIGMIVFLAVILKDISSGEWLSRKQCSFVTYMRVQSGNVQREFNLKKYYTTSEESKIRLIPAITNYRKAQLSDCNLTEQSCDTLRTVLQSEKSTLKELDLSNNYLRDSGVEKLSAGLKSSQLENLRLVMCELSEQSCKTLQSVLQSETCSLKELDLSNNDLQDTGVEELSAGLKSSHCKLANLRLVMCKLSERSCKTLQSVLQSETCSLKQLDLSNNDLQDTGVEELSAGLKISHCKLEILRSSGCMITEKGCNYLASSLSSIPSHLKELDLTYNNPGESGVKQLSDKLNNPQCSLQTLRVEHGGNIRMKTGLKKYGCDLTLDPNTAHSYLSLSEENRRVKRRGWQAYPDDPERFDYWSQVLSRESVTGRCYWEAELSGRGAEVALSYKSISRKGSGSDSRFGLNEKSWSLKIDNNSYSVHHNKHRTDLPPPPSPSNRVGVYVDCPAGTLSFYSISSNTHTPSHTHTHTLTHLHTFYTTFTEPLCAGFYLIYFNSSVRLCDIE